MRIDMNSLETILEYLETRETLPDDVKRAVDKVKKSKIFDEGYFVHNNALDCNPVIGFGETPEESADNIKIDLGISLDESGELGAETLNEWLRI
jgi:hypothetical protein